MSSRRVRLVLLRHGRTSWNADGPRPGPARRPSSTRPATPRRPTPPPALAAPRPGGPVVLRQRPRARDRGVRRQGDRPRADVRRPAARVLPRRAPGPDARGVRRAARRGVRGVPHRQLRRRPRRRDRRRGLGADGGRAATSCSPGLAPGECAVAVSHGAAIRDAVPVLLGWPVERAQPRCTASTTAAGSSSTSAEPGGPLRLRGLQPGRGALSGPRFHVRRGVWLRFRALLRRRPERRVWGCGAAGSAPAWHAGGQGFESPQLHRMTGPQAMSPLARGRGTWPSVRLRRPLRRTGRAPPLAPRCGESGPEPRPSE